MWLFRRFAAQAARLRRNGEKIMEHTLCVPCLLGLEGPIADELDRKSVV